MDSTNSNSTGSSGKSSLTKALLICGILSSLLYVGADILAAMLYEGYRYTDQAISELPALGSPTRPLLLWLFSLYNVLGFAFVLGVWDMGNRALRTTAVLLIGYFIVGQVCLMYFPMHTRGEGFSMTDTMHKILTGVSVLFLLLAVGFGARANGKWFRFYSIATILVLIVFGVWAGFDAPRIGANLSTPWHGVKERVNVYGIMFWVIMLAVVLMRKDFSKIKT